MDDSDKTDVDSEPHAPFCDPYCRFIARDDTGKPISVSFGSGVSLSDPWLAVGASSGNVCVFLYKRENTGEWKLRQQIKCSSLNILDLNGDTLVLANSADGTAADGAGVVKLFRLNKQDTWQELQTLTPPDAQSLDSFGFGKSGALSPKYLAVGSSRNVEGSIEGGSVHVYERQTTGKYSHTTSLTAKLPGNIADGEEKAQFGSDIAIYDDHVVVGSPHKNLTVGGSLRTKVGAAYVYGKQPSGVWSPLARLSQSDGRNYDFFGQSVGINESTVAVSAPGIDPNAEENRYYGAAYVFGRDAVNNTWSQKDKIVPAEIRGSFATYLRLVNDRLVIFAGGELDDPIVLMGTLDLYAQKNEKMTFVRRLEPPPEAKNKFGFFGYSQAVDGRYVVAASSGIENIAEKTKGAVLIFDNVYK